MPTNNRPITIGADPEFAFSKDGSPVRAGAILRGGTAAQFGTDGASNTAELRPDPADTASGLVENIRKVIAAEVRRHPDLLGYDWNAVPSFNRQPLGGHIHFGFPPNPEFTKMLDTLLAYPYAMMESSAGARSRKEYYGRLSDVRAQPWGMEYRSLSTWLVNEERAHAVLATAHALATLWVQDRVALTALFLNAGGPLAPQELLGYRKHSKTAMRERALKVREALKSLRHPALSQDHLDGIKRFCILVRVGAYKGVGQLGETVMSWTLDGVKMKAGAQEREAATREARRAEREAMVARQRALAALNLSTMERAWTAPLVEQGIPVQELSWSEADDRLGEICGPMTQRAGRAWTIPSQGATVRVYGLRADRAEGVRLAVSGSPVLVDRLNRVAAWLGERIDLPVVVVPGNTLLGTVEVGLRRDIRDTPELCRRVLTVVALAMRNIVEVA